MAVRSFIGGSLIVGAAAWWDNVFKTALANVKTDSQYVSLTYNTSYYTSVNSKVQIPAADLLDVAVPLPLKVAKACPNMMGNEWCVALGALAMQFPNYVQWESRTHGFLAGNHTTTSVETGPEGLDTVICHRFTDSFYCHGGMGNLMSTYSVLADNGAVGYGVMCHTDAGQNSRACHLLGDGDVFLFPRPHDQSALVTASPLGQIVNLATCNCLTYTSSAPSYANVWAQPCDEGDEAFSGDQSFWVDSDASVHPTNFFPDGTVLREAGKPFAGTVYLGSDQTLPDASWSTSPFLADATPATADSLHFIIEGSQTAITDIGNRYKGSNLNEDDDAQRFAFVCETCANTVVPCRSHSSVV